MNNLKTKCNCYSFYDLTIGLEESFHITVTQEMQNLFMELSGDINPMHIDRDYAIREGYGDCLVRGTGITINGLSPNMVETKFLSNIDKRMIEINGRESSMHRNINIKEVVSGLRFLLSDDSNYMTGINLNMTGGDRM